MPDQRQSVRNREIMQRLAEPFDPDEIKWKPGSIAKDGSRAMALAYVDARVVQDRLDEVVGQENWQDDYEPMSDGSVICRLKVRLGDEWITKVDVGSISEQPDAGDRNKAAFSDALKRAAVKFGIGRFLYSLPSQWVDWDANKRRFAKPPQLPGFAKKVAPAIKAEEPVANGDPSVAETEELKERNAAYEAGNKILSTATDLATLARAWNALSMDMRKVCAKEKDRLKKEFQENEHAAAHQPPA